MPIDLYDEEIRQVMQIAERLNSKYKEQSPDKLLDLMNEAQFEFYKIGLKVTLTTDEKTGYFTFDITGRTSNHDFDYEKKNWEVRKSRETGEEVPEL